MCLLLVLLHHVQAPATRIPKLDFTVLAGDHAWATVRAQVMAALESHCCFEVVHEGLLSPELRDGIFSAAEELFGLPLETKTKSISGGSYGGYLGPWHGIPDYESLSVPSPENASGAQTFTSLMWHDGNPTFIMR